MGIWGRATPPKPHYRHVAVIVGGDGQTQALFVGSSPQSQTHALGVAVQAMKDAEPRWHVGAHVTFTVDPASADTRPNGGDGETRLHAKHG